MVTDLNDQGGTRSLDLLLSKNCWIMRVHILCVDKNLDAIGHVHRVVGVCVHVLMFCSKSFCMCVSIFFQCVCLLSILLVCLSVSADVCVCGCVCVCVCVCVLCM